MKKLVFLFVLLFSGCAAMTPGGISVKKSDFDGSTEVVMTPAYVCKEGTFGSCMIKLGLHRTSRMPADDVVMTVMIGSLEHFSADDGVQFNIDGEIVTLSSPDREVKFEVNSNTAYIDTWAYRTYIVKKDFIKKLLDGTRVAMKVSTNKGYYEGVFSSDKPTTAKGPFGDFLQKAFEVKI